MSNELTEKIQTLITPFIEQIHGFLVEIVIRGEHQSKIIEIYVDTDEGITTEQCATISRNLSQQLDETPIIQGNYRIIVSSPDLERPLKLYRQYQKNIGRFLKITFMDEQKTSTIEGTLEKIEQEELSIQTKTKKHLIPREKIKEAYVIPQFK